MTIITLFVLSALLAYIVWAKIRPALTPSAITSEDTPPIEGEPIDSIISRVRLEAFEAGYHAAQMRAVYQVTKNGRILVDTSPSGQFFRATHVFDDRGIRPVCRRGLSQMPVAQATSVAMPEPPPINYDLEPHY
jgi:hypothetical protein